MFRRAVDATAGRTTRDYYELRLRDWHRSLRGPAVVSMALAAGFAYPLWRWAPLGEFYAGVCVGGFLGMLVWLRDDPPHAIAKWKLGADGEQQTARELSRLPPAWSAVHDRTMGRGNLDHIVVGPGGVFLLETKNLAGSVRVDERGLTVSYGAAAIDSSTYNLEATMRGRAATLRERIKAETDLGEHVHAVVVIWSEFAQQQFDGERVTYLAGDKLYQFLAKQPERLSPRDVNLIRLALAANVVAPPAPAFETS